MDRIIFEYSRLEREEEIVEKEFLALIARLVRFYKQKRLFREKGKVMVEKGFKDLDELEAAEQTEAATTASAPLLIVSPDDTIDWSRVDLSDLLGPDDSGDIVAKGAGNSSNDA